MFQILVVLVLAILIVNQFELWNKFKDWMDDRTEGESPLEKSHSFKINAYGIIIIVGVIAALVISYFQVRNEVDVNATRLAIQALSAETDAVISNSAINAQAQLFRELFDFGNLYFNKFLENTGLFILLPILISLGTVFMQEEMKKNKEQMTNFTIGKDNNQSYNYEVSDEEIERADEPIEVEIDGNEFD